MRVRNNDIAQFDKKAKINNPIWKIKQRRPLPYEKNGKGKDSLSLQRIEEK